MKKKVLMYYPEAKIVQVDDLWIVYLDNDPIPLGSGDKPYKAWDEARNLCQERFPDKWYEFMIREDYPKCLIEWDKDDQMFILWSTPAKNDGENSYCLGQGKTHLEMWEDAWQMMMDSG